MLQHAMFLLQDQGGGFMNMLPMLLGMAAIMYFVMIRPQSRERRARAQMLSELKKGDEVVLQSGILATIHRVDAETPIAVVEVEDGARMRVLRDAIMKRMGDPEPAPAKAKGGATSTTGTKKASAAAAAQK